MRVFSSHWRGGDPPRLIQEGFSWAGAFWGAIYLAAHRAWVAATLNFAAALACLAAARALHDGAPLAGLFVLQGLFVRDLHRWGLARAGWIPGPIVAAQDQDAALARLLDSGTVPALAGEPA